MSRQFNIIITFSFIFIWVVFITNQFFIIRFKDNNDFIPGIALRPLNFPQSTISLKKGFKEIDNWYSKNYSFRKKLWHIDQLLQYNLFNLSMHSSVISGKDGWLFLKKDGGIGKNHVEDYQNIPLTNDQVQAIISKLQHNNNLLKARGITYIIFAAPNSASIYPEYLPLWVKRYYPYSKLDQIINSIKNTDLNFIDLRPALLKAKKWKQLYYKTDTHWNAYGAYVAYQSLISQMSKITHNNKLIPIDLVNFNISGRNDSCTDLSMMLGYCNLQREDIHYITNKNPGINITTLEFNNIGLGQKIEAINTNIADQNMKVLVFRDSYFIYLLPYLAENFHYSYFVWNNSLDFELIDKIKPKYVIHEIVERSIMYLVN